MLVSSVDAMRMPTEWLDKQVQARMYDQHARGTAPIALWGCLASLTSGAETVASLVEKQATEPAGTEWRAAWLTETVLAYGTVTKSIQDWTFSDLHDCEPDSIDGWVRPLSGVSSLDLGSVVFRRVPTPYSDSDQEWSWSSTTRVHFNDGLVIEVPLFGGSTNDERDVEVRGFVDALVRLL